MVDKSDLFTSRAQELRVRFGDRMAAARRRSANKKNS